MPASVKLGNFLYKNAFGIYRILYGLFKRKQDAFEIGLLKKYINKGDTVLDIGANIGFYAEILSKLCGENGKLHCFEPDPKNFGHLEKKCGGLGNVTLNNAAVAARNGTIHIYLSKELNVDHRAYEPEEYERKIEIPAVSVDEYLQGKKADFVKMDIQGFEPEALKGMEKTLAANENIKLICEFWPYGLKRSGHSATGMFSWLKQRNFNCYLLEKNSLALLDENRTRDLEKLADDKRYYFNIFVSRKNV